jgi:DNA mismatch endonuclease (patch repair protein)
MRSNRKRDTKPEVTLRSGLHRAGLRFRKDLPLRPDNGRQIRVDVAFTRQRVAVFVDGCFWHSCPIHGRLPRSNPSYWRPNLARNTERDREVDGRLEQAGWTVVRVWEHDNLADSLAKIRAALRPPDTSRRLEPPTGGGNHLASHGSASR